MNKASLEKKKEVFDLLVQAGSEDFAHYLRAYEGIPRPPAETLEVSCELVDGARKDRARMAVFNLRRQEVLNWLEGCRINIPSFEKLVFENEIDGCFMIGLADYLSEERGCRLKIYNEYMTSKSVGGGGEHAEQLFSLLDIPDHEFKKDLRLFKKIKIGAVEWDREHNALVKIYFGDFDSRELLGRFSKILHEEERLCYERMRSDGLLPEVFHFCVRYTKEGAKSLKVELNCRTRRIVPYLEQFDPNREAAKFFRELYRLFPGLRMEFMSMQWAPAQKVQFYFRVY